MNLVDKDFIKVPADVMKSFVASIAQEAGMPPEKAEFLADLLVKNDLRGVFSHGTQQIATYAVIMRDHLINPNPRIFTVKETPTTIIVDGDGGLGYFAAYKGAEAIIKKCRANGLAAAVARNHGHIDRKSVV